MAGINLNGKKLVTEDELQELAKQQDLEDLETATAAHWADKVTDAGGVHGLTIQEGVWTPFVRGGSVTGTNTYINQRGTFYKVGKKVTCSFHIKLEHKDVAMAGTAMIGGLPFSMASSNRFGASFTIYTGIDFSASPSMVGRTQLMGYGDSNVIILTASGDNVTSGIFVLTVASVKDGMFIEGSITYFTN